MTGPAARAGLLLWSLGLASAAGAQTLGHGQEDPVSLWRVAGVLVLCLCLAVAGAYALRARVLPTAALATLSRRDRKLQLLETLRLSQHVDLCLVRCGAKTMLVSTSVQGLQILPYSDHAPDIAADDVDQTLAAGPLQ